MQPRIIYNGKEYASVADMPDGVRQAYQAALAHLADADGNGIPDIMERGPTGDIISVQQSSITVNGRTFESVGEMPAFIRRLFESAMSHAPASRDGIGDAADHAVPMTRIAGHATEAARPEFTRVAPGSLLEKLGGRDHHLESLRRLDRMSRPLDVFLGTLLAVVAVIVFAGAIVMITTLEASSRSQGGRIYIAIAAMVVLGALDSQAALLVKRRWGLGFFGESAISRRFAMFSVLFLALAAAILFGLALFLP